MTQSQIDKAAKKADLALCKLMDLYYGHNITGHIANRIDKACTAIREVLNAIESTEPESRRK